MIKKIDSFVEFWNEIKRISVSEDEILVFRGLSDLKYNLEANCYRNTKKDAERTSYRSIRVEYPEEFQTVSHVSNLAKMQHYGCTTRLLDFTLNPLIALYFSVEQDISKNGQVVICKIKRNDILHHTSDRALMLSCLPCFSDEEHREIRDFCEKNKRQIDDKLMETNITMKRFLHEIRREVPSFNCEIVGEDLLNNYFIQTHKDNERIRIQNALFMIFGVGNIKLEDMKSISLTRINVSKEAKKEILADLRKINISSSTVYPSLERRAMDLARKRVDWVSIDN